MRLPNPNVIHPTAKNIAAHFQSPLNKGTKKPKKKFVQEKPIGASLSCLVFLFSNVITAKAINIINIMINFAINKAFNNFFNFSGRSNRSEFWYFFLFIFLASFLTHVIDTYILGYHPDETRLVSGVFLTITFIPQLSIIVRRLHDVGKSGWWFLLSFTVIGLIPLIVWYCSMSEPRKNKFCNIPKMLSHF